MIAALQIEIDIYIERERWKKNVYSLQGFEIANNMGYYILQTV